MDFVQLQRAYHERVNQALTRLIDPLPFQSSPLVNAMQYGALLGGKRLRPFLVYATGEMLRAEAASLDRPRRSGGVHSRLLIDS
jgi:Geranylgeranyl pyrophosphate synthase